MVSWRLLRLRLLPVWLAFGGVVVGGSPLHEASPITCLVQLGARVHHHEARAANYTQTKLASHRGLPGSRSHMLGRDDGMKGAFASLKLQPERADAVEDMWPDFIVACCTGVLLLQAVICNFALRTQLFFDEGGFSRLTRMCAASVGTAMYSLALCTYFISYHFYTWGVLGGTRIPGWAQRCMILSCVGVELRYVAICLLIARRRVERSTIEELNPTGETHGVLWMASNYDFEEVWVPRTAVALNFCGHLLVDWGGFGVSIGILAVPLDVNRVVPSVLCALFLCMVYLLSSFVLEHLRLLEALVVYLKDSRGEEKTSSIVGGIVLSLGRALGVGQSPVWDRHPEVGLMHAAHRAAAVVIKGPSLAVLYLITWLAGNQPDSMPVPLLRACVMATTCALFLETLAAAALPLFRTRPQLRALAELTAHLAAGGGFAGVIYLLESYFWKLPSEGKLGLTAAMMLVLLFWVVHFFQWFFTLAFGARSLPRTLAISLQTAHQKVAMCPMTAFLFVAFWLRAHTLASGAKSPQPWAQDLMMVSAIAKLVTILPLVFSVLSAGMEDSTSTLDGDGHALDSRRPITSYMLVLTDSLAFCCFQIGTASIIVSPFLLTDEAVATKTAGHDAGVAVLILFSVFLSLGKLLSLTVKLALESTQRLILPGLEVSIEQLAVSIAYGYVAVHGLRVSNPESGGMHWKSPNLLMIEHVQLKVETKALILSLGRELNIKKLKVFCLRINYEVPAGHSASNLWLLWSMVHSLTSPKRKKLLPDFGTCCHPFFNSPNVNQPQPVKEEVTRHVVKVTSTVPDEVWLEDIGANFSVWGVPERLQLQDIRDENFAETLAGAKHALWEVASKSTTTKDRAADVMHLTALGAHASMWLLETLAHSALAEAKLLLSTMRAGNRGSSIWVTHLSGELDHHKRKSRQIVV
mmetsp:Transcript_804/g.1982  ORF Transcript_804/g.1982 Transcript_804/m.1982 type:complete len:922 (+) Transcript_804:178-2943(+)